MKEIFLSIVVPVLLVTLGFGQTPVLSGNTDQASIKGCLGGSDGNYTLAEDGTAQTFKITTSTVDLKAYLGHDVELIGQKANVATSSGSSDNRVAVTNLNMISDHCATTAATASTSAAADTTPPTTVKTSAAADTTPATTASASAAADTTPATTASASAAADTTPATTASASAATDTTPATTASAPADTADTPMIASARAPESTKQLPNTATPLPLLGLLGLGLLATGLLSRRPRTS